MIGYDYHLDLLGVRYDAELELRAMHELAKETAEYWKENCSDGDFYKNCMETICKEFGATDGKIPEEATEVWKIIEENYI